MLIAKGGELSFELPSSPWHWYNADEEPWVHSFPSKKYQRLVTPKLITLIYRAV